MKPEKSGARHNYTELRAGHNSITFEMPLVGSARRTTNRVPGYSRIAVNFYYASGSAGRWRKCGTGVANNQNRYWRSKANRAKSVRAFSA